jgi:O-6-methylguanine DNA methyltransferase
MLRRETVIARRTYEDIALDVGLSHDVEAVCDACAANQIALAIPCHRALGAMNTSPAGYRWGRTRQRELIDREVAVSAGIYAPGSASLIMPHLRVKRWSELDKEFEARVRDLFLK